MLVAEFMPPATTPAAALADTAAHIDQLASAQTQVPAQSTAGSCTRNAAHRARDPRHPYPGWGALIRAPETLSQAACRWLPTGNYKLYAPCRIILVNFTLGPLGDLRAGQGFWREEFARPARRRKMQLAVKTDTASVRLPRQYQPHHFLPLPFTLAA